MQGLQLELARGAISLAVTLIGLGIGWAIGRRLTYQWNLRQVRRESDLATTHDLQRLYGEFFAIWKQWNRSVRGSTEEGMPGPADLLRRACDAEGLVERVFVKLATERSLSPTDLDVLGRFRQGYQQLRKAIETGKPLAWVSSEHPEYLAFKRLAVAVTGIVRREGRSSPVPGAEAYAALVEITSNRHERTWAS